VGAALLVIDMQRAIVPVVWRGVDTVVITGVATDYCVDATARSALSHGLHVVLVGDGHVPAAEGDPDAGLTPRQIVAHHNRVLGNAIHPGGQLRVCAGQYGQQPRITVRGGGHINDQVSDTNRVQPPYRATHLDRCRAIGPAHHQHGGMGAAVDNGPSWRGLCRCRGNGRFSRRACD